jgi:glutamyl-tRNA reductase
VASAAVDLARQIFGELSGRRVLVLGAGKMGELAARHLLASGVGELIVVNRTLLRAEELARKLGGRAVHWDELDGWLREVDIVLCSTGAAEPVVRHERVEKVMRARRGRFLFFIDIAVPRDVEPRVGEVENVFLYDVDALAAVVEENLASRAREADEARAIIDEEMARLRELELALGVVPTIKLLRSRFLEVAQAEAQKTLGKLAGASERDRAQVEQLVESIVNKLLHAPLSALKREAKRRPDSDELAATVRALFDLHTGHTEEIRIGDGTGPVEAVSAAGGRERGE